MYALRKTKTFMTMYHERLYFHTLGAYAPNTSMVFSIFFFTALPGCQAANANVGIEQLTNKESQWRISYSLNWELLSLCIGACAFALRLHPCRALCQESFQNISALASAATTAWNSKFKVHTCSFSAERGNVEAWLRTPVESEVQWFREG